MKKILFITLIAICMFSCRKDPPQLSQAIAPYAGPINVIVNQSLPGYAVPATFEGLSFETQILTANPDFLNANNAVLLQLIKNLGPGILRIGGASSDEIHWSKNIRSANTTADSLTTSDIDRLSAFSKATGWPVLFGLNLGSNDAGAAANEAVYVSNSLGANLDAFQSGNEPDVYNAGIRAPTYNVFDYLGEWETYLSAIRNKVPQAPFAGPDVAENTDWITLFAENESGNVKLLDGHYYTTGPATDMSINYHTILKYDSALSDYLQITKTESAKYNLPYRITECNNVYGGGKPSVSNVFASALWALDFMWTVAENNVAGINFHGGYGLSYSPVLINNGVLSASPEYYAMLAFKYASTGGTIIPTEVSNSELCSAYACVKADNTYCLTLINKDDTNNYLFSVQLNKPATSIQIARLEAPSITATTGITFAGGTVTAAGAFQTNLIEQYPVNGQSFTVKVHAGSAVIVTIL